MPIKLPTYHEIDYMSTWERPHGNIILRGGAGREMEVLGVFGGMQDFACSAKRFFEKGQGTDFTLIPNKERRPWGRPRTVFHGYHSYECFASANKPIGDLAT